MEDYVFNANVVSEGSGASNLESIINISYYKRAEEEEEQKSYF